jgi:hypothetical protein
MRSELDDVSIYGPTSLILDPNDYDRSLADVEPPQLPTNLVRTYPTEGMKAGEMRLAGCPH